MAQGHNHRSGQPRHEVALHIQQIGRRGFGDPVLLDLGVVVADRLLSRARAFASKSPWMLRLAGFFGANKS